MLSSEQSIIVYEGSRASPDRLTRNDHAHYVQYAERMLAVYRGGVGQTRRELHRSVAGIFANESDCSSKRIRAFCKLLDDVGEFETDSRGNAATLRLRVFSLAAPLHPLVRTAGSLFGTPESEVKTKIARELGLSWEEIDRKLYADVLDFQRLIRFGGYGSAEMLLRHYNVAQIQACLYRAENMIIIARQDFKRILRHIKFARLMFEIRRLKNSEYRIHLTGPTSVLTETRRYGVQFAQIIPALLACDNWEMEAVVQTPWRMKARFCLKSTEGLRSHLPATQEYDSGVEAIFAAKFGEKRNGWSLVREAVILHDEQVTFVPDFAFRHDDGTEVLFEIVGFWTSKYLEQKRETLRRFRNHRILLAVPECSLTPGQTPSDKVIVYKTVIKIEPVLQALEKCIFSNFFDAL
ncbi:MAG: DUF790 family protein [Planctomycetota bacterium]